MSVRDTDLLCRLEVEGVSAYRKSLAKVINRKRKEAECAVSPV